MNLLSTLYLKTNSHTDEKISIGLFAIGSGRRFFSYSLEKIKIANSIIETNIESSIRHTLKNINKEVDAYNNSDLKFNDFGLNEASFDYLNTYSKGILSFEKLKPVAIDIEKSTFDNLFNLLVNSSPEKSTIISFSRRVNNKLKNKAFDQVDVKYDIKPSIIETYAAHKVDFIGKNGSFLVGNSIDFNGRPETIDRSIMEFKAITNALESLSVKLNLPRGKYNIYCNEPESKEGKTFFNKVYSDNEKSFNLYTLDKLDDVINQLESTEYIKFSEYLKEINL